MPENREDKESYVGCVEGILIILVAIFFYIMASKMEMGSQLHGGFGPDLYPKIILGAIIIIGLLLLISSFRKSYLRRKSIVEPRVEQSYGFEAEISKEYKESVTPVIPIIFSFLYGFIIMFLGYVLGTLFFLISIMSLLTSFKKPKLVIPVSVMWTMVITVLFLKIFYVPLPKGVGIFYDFNLYLLQLFQ